MLTLVKVDIPSGRHVPSSGDMVGVRTPFYSLFLENEKSQADISIYVERKVRTPSHLPPCQPCSRVVPGRMLLACGSSVSARRERLRGELGRIRISGVFTEFKVTVG